jgi:predicted  nucleic acid-binding Zn-ribbon protein
MDQETLTLLTKAGEVVILCLTLLLSVWWNGRNASQNSSVMLQATQMQRDTNAELNKSLDRLSATSEASTEALIALRAEVQLNNAKVTEHNQYVADFRTGMDSAVKNMFEVTGKRNEQIAELPGKVAGEVKVIMVDELKKLPGEISAEINPALAEIATQVKALSEKIEQVVPSQIKELVTPEFEELKAKVNRLLAIMDQQKTPTIDAAPPQEKTE